MNTYTPQGGYSPQAQATAGLQNTMASMPPVQGPAAQAGNQAAANMQGMYQQAPQAMADARQGFGQQAGFSNVAQAGQNMDASYQLFLKDMQLAQQKQAPAPADNPQGPGFYGGNLMLTQGANDAGFQGFTNPADASSYYGKNENNAVSALSSLLKNTSNFNMGQYKSDVGTVQDQINNMIGLYKSQYDAAQKVADQAESKRQFDASHALDTLKAYYDAESKGLIGGDNSPLAQDAEISADNLSGLTSSKEIQAYYKSIPKEQKRFVDQALAKRGVNMSDVAKFPAVRLVNEMEDLRKSWLAILPAKRAANQLGQYADPQTAAVMSQLGSITQRYAKTIEGNRVTNADFIRYQNQLANNWQNNAAANATFNAAIKSLSGALGISKDDFVKYYNYNNPSSATNSTGSFDYSQAKSVPGQSSDWEIVQ